LKRNNDELHSSFAFKFNLRRYNEDAEMAAAMAASLKQAEVGRFQLTPD
jgi:hypothetical protein